MATKKHPLLALADESGDKHLAPALEAYAHSAKADLDKETCSALRSKARDLRTAAGQVRHKPVE